MPGTAIKMDGKKFIWDKGLYLTESEAKEKSTQYQKNNFEVMLLEKEGKYLLYTRRLATATASGEGGQPL